MMTRPAAMPSHRANSSLCVRTPLIRGVMSHDNSGKTLGVLMLLKEGGVTDISGWPLLLRYEFRCI
jgi:hypothetical protein